MSQSAAETLLTASRPMLDLVVVLLNHSERCCESVLLHLRARPGFQAALWPLLGLDAARSGPTVPAGRR